MEKMKPFMTQVTFNEVVNALAVKYWDLKEGIDASEIDADILLLWRHIRLLL